MEPTLVILAAGLGRRFGGLKQLEPVGPGGATIIDYSVYDARRAGFDRVVFVVRRETEREFRAGLLERLAPHVEVECVFQQLDALPAGRTKPWGTGHAVLAAADVVRGPFAVVNGDDFYGADAYAVLGAFLRQPQGPGVPTHAMVGYRLGDTLVDSGSVSRAVCRYTPGGWLREIVELTGIERAGDDVQYGDEQGNRRIVRGDERVSMNMWGFQPEFFEELHAAFRAFLKDHGESVEAEFYLPSAIQQMTRAGRGRVKVLSSGASWCGLTHATDTTSVRAQIEARIARGEYPADLWG